MICFWGSKKCLPVVKSNLSPFWASSVFLRGGEIYSDRLFLVTLSFIPANYKFKRMALYSELKFLDGFSGVVTSKSTGEIVLLSHNIVPQGTAQSSRIGRKITIRSLDVRGGMILPSTGLTDDMDNRLRIVFYIDTQTNGASATVPEIFRPLPSIGVVSIFSFYELSNESRFQIIYDETFDFPIGAIDLLGENAPISQSFAFSCNLDLPIEYDATATTGAIGTQRTNNIGSLVIAEQGAVLPSIGYGFRIQYTDS